MHVLVFRIAHESFGDAKHRDFALVRRLKPAPRHNDGRFPRMASELRMPDLDLGPTGNKLGVLWTWDRNERSRRPIYTVLAAEEVRETAAMMPHWEPIKLVPMEHLPRGVQEQISDGPSHAPAVPKAMRMFGLTAVRFYTAVITSSTSERLYQQIAAK